MRLSAVLTVAVLIVTADAVNSARRDPRCARGPGYWCSSEVSAKRCGATEFCSQLRARTAGGLSGEVRVSGESVPHAACDLCGVIVSEARLALQQHKSEAEIAQLMKARLPRDRLVEETVEALETLVDIYLTETIAALNSGVEPKQICTLLDLCGSSSRGVKSPATSATLPKYARHPVLLLMQLRAPQEKPLAAAVSCQSCHQLVTVARQLVRDGRTEAELLQLLKSTACVLLPAESERSKCSSLMDKYLPIVFELLSTELDPTIVCQILGACQQQQQQQQLPPAPISSPPTSPEPAITRPQCLLCEFIVSEVEHQVGAARSADAIRSALNEVCSALHPSVRSECDSQIRQSGRLMQRLLMTGLRSKLLCRSIGACSAVHRPLPSAKWMLAYRRSTVAVSQRHRLLLERLSAGGDFL